MFKLLGKGELTYLLVFTLLITCFSFIVNAEDGMWQIFNTPGDYKEIMGNDIPTYNEAPGLKNKVNSGELPVVKDRLPVEPVVVDPVNEIGKYGGTWVRAWKGLSDEWAINKPIGERFLTYDEEGKIAPNIARGWEIIDNKKGIIFYLREGMKWSDGEPLTVDDVVFWFNDIKLYDELSTVEPGPWDTLEYGGEKAKIEKIDKYTFKVSFAVPAANKFLQERAGYGPSTMIAPKHYLSKFHKKYTSEERLHKMAKEKGYGSWVELFGEKVNYLRNPELPVVYAWKVVNDYSSSELKLERNPYYWKIDKAGNQLPYMDKVSVLLIEDSEVMVMQTISGKINLQNRHITIDNYPLLKGQAEQGGYKVYLYPRPMGANNAMYLNHTSEDPVKRKLYNNVNFKKALSYALNRDEINDIFYLGIGKARQASYVKNSPFYSEEWATAYVEYNPEKANQILDKMGMEYGDDGYRLSPDGEKFEIEITIQAMSSGGGGSNSQIAELYKHYFNDIGIKSSIKNLERSLMEERQEANKVDMRLSDFGPMLRPDGSLFNRLVPLITSHAYWSPKWAEYYATGGKSGEKPPADVLRLQELSKEMDKGPEWFRVKEIMAEIAEIHRKNLYVIGTVGEVPTPYVAAEYIKNMPDEILDTGTYRNIARVLPIQIYIDK